MSDLVIETKKLTKIYGEQTAVNSVNLHVKPGRIYGLLGRNGAGKTTIMKMILGLTPITSGEVDVFGQNIKGHEKRIYPRIGAIIETPGFYPNLTGTENLEIFAKLRGTPQPNAVKNALEVVGLPYKDKKLFSKYSLGMKQRLGIANAILHDPELLILDEPTNGLDPIGIAEVRNFIKNLSVERGKTILISSHILSEISLLADDIGIIDHGVLLEESSMDELEKKNRKLKQLDNLNLTKECECMKKLIALVLTLACVLALTGCGKNDTYKIKIVVPAGSTEEIVYQEDFVYSDEEISPIGNKITIYSGDGLGDTEVVLKPISVKEENAYEPTYLTPGMPVEMDVEKGAWFKVGINMQNNTDTDKIVYVEIEGVEVRIE